MHRLVWLFLLAAVSPGLARVAVVAPATGPVLRGQVRLTERGIVVVNARQDLWRELPLTNLAWAVFESPPAPAAAVADETLPEPWLETDIGSVTLRGNARHVAGAVTIQSAGRGIQGEADSLHYVYRRTDGDTEIVAHLAAVHQTHLSALAGLMMRESLGPESRQITVGLNPLGTGLVVRREQGGAPAQIQAYRGWGLPCWLKLKRQGGDFIIYQSRNGCRWRLVDKVALRMNSAFNAGLASASGRDGTLNWTTFQQVEVGDHLCLGAFPPRAELVSGSLVVGRPISFEDGRMDFRWGLDTTTVPTRSIARLIFQWASPEWLAQLPRAQNGIWLANGEFLDADLRGVDLGQVRVSSVISGTRTLDANGEVLLVVLQRSSPHPTPFEVRTVNGSVWRARSLSLGDNELILQEPALGRLSLPLQALASITRSRE